MLYGIDASPVMEYVFSARTVLIFSNGSLAKNQIGFGQNAVALVPTQITDFTRAHKVNTNGELIIATIGQNAFNASVSPIDGSVGLIRFGVFSNGQKMTVLLQTGYFLVKMAPNIQPIMKMIQPNRIKQIICKVFMVSIIVILFKFL